MIYTIFGFDYVFDLQFFQLTFLCAILGLLSKYLLQIINLEYFVVGINQILVFSLLPVTGFIITSAISNNIALSLGMVGALSIVRFRTPVKNPLELVIYFYLITLGIVTSVNPSIAINFTIFFVIATIATEVYKLVIKNFLPSKKVVLNFEHFLRINVSKEIAELDNLKNLTHKSFDSNEYLYTFGFSTREEIKNLLDKIDKKDIINYSIDTSK